MQKVLILVILLATGPRASASEFSRMLSKHPNSQTAKCFDYCNAPAPGKNASQEEWQEFKFHYKEYKACTDACYSLSKIEFPEYWGKK